MTTSLRRMISNVISNLSSCSIRVSPVPRYPTFNFFEHFTWWLSPNYSPINLNVFSGRHISYTTSSPKKITDLVSLNSDWWIILGPFDRGIVNHHPILHKSHAKPRFAEQDLYWESREFPTQPLDAWRRSGWSHGMCARNRTLTEMLPRFEFSTQPSKWLKHLCPKIEILEIKRPHLSISLKSVIGFSSQCQALTFQTSSAASFFMETRHLDLGLANRFKYETVATNKTIFEMKDLKYNKRT